MRIADSHEFIELYRGDKDLRMGIELVKLDEDVQFISFAPDRTSPTDRDRFGKDYLEEVGIPELCDGFELKLLPSKSIRFSAKETGGIMSFMPTYGRELKKAKPDVIFENPFSWLTPRSYQTYRYSKRFKVPVVYYDPGDDIPISFKHQIMAYWESPVVKHVSEIITYNEAGKQRFIKKYDYPAERIHVIPKPVDVPIYRYDGDVSDIRATYGADEDTIVVGYLGRLASYKGSSLLLEVAQSVEDDPRFSKVRFVFIGGALASNESEDEYRRNNTYVTGMIAHDQVPKYIAACDVIAYPERNPDFGGFSTAIAETMAAGKAIIFGTKTPGFYVPLINDFNAKVVPPCNPPAVKQAILELVEHPEMIIRLGSEMRQFASENMDYPVVARAYLDILKAAYEESAGVR